MHIVYIGLFFSGACEIVGREKSQWRITIN